MASSSKRPSRRKRVGKVSYYSHHNGWWVYYSESGQKVRRRVADDEKTAAQVAAQINGHLMTQAPTFFSFQPITIFNLQKEFIDHHEHVLRSSLATVKRYRTATQHLVTFSQLGKCDTFAHELNADEFVRYLRSLQVSPNGHKNARCRPLRDKGVRYILDCCRSMFNFAAKKRHLPPYADSPFLGLGGKRFRIEDAKRIFVFDEQTELTFLKAANWWSFPIFFTLAKLGIRPGELTHLLIEEVDLDSGWIHIRNKVELGWRIKTGAERSIPIPSELVAVLRRVMEGRTKGPVFIRHQYLPSESSLGNVGLNRLCQTVQTRTNTAQLDSEEILTREQLAKIQRGVWRDAGAIRRDTIRINLMQISRNVGMPHVTCPKSWRHTFATLLQDANIDPLIRQIVLGHSPSTFGEGALGMTSRYTHPRPETIKREVEQAVRLWPAALDYSQQWLQGGESC